MSVLDNDNSLNRAVIDEVISSGKTIVNEYDSLLDNAKNGDKQAMDELLTIYEQLVANITRKYFLRGGDESDLMQIGRIALYKAILSYDKDKSSFVGYAINCIRRDTIDALRQENRLKNIALNESVDLDEQRTFARSIEDEVLGELFVKKTLDYIKTLKNHEIFMSYLDGYSYNDIADKYSITTKKVDNILQSFKKKLKEYLKIVNF